MKHLLGSSDSALGILGIWRTGVSGQRAEGARPPEINHNILKFIKEVVCVRLAATKAVLCASAASSGVHHALESSCWAGSRPVVCRNLAMPCMCLLCFITAVLPAPGLGVEYMSSAVQEQLGLLAIAASVDGASGKHQDLQERCLLECVCGCV